MRLAKAFVLVWEEHDPELANKRIKAGVRERQGGGVGGLKLDRFVRAEFPTCHLKHWRIEIRSRQMRFYWQYIAKTAGDDPGARCDF
jgi:hypothetical protein